MREYSSRLGPQTAQRVERLYIRIDRLYMPAMPPLWLFALIGYAVQRCRKRRAVKALLKRDDHILRDLGHSRAELRGRLDQRRNDEARMRDCAVRSVS